jgi:hypothetical protein
MAAWETACRAAADAVPVDDVASAEELARRCDAGQDVPPALRGAVLWAMARRAEGMRSKLCGLFVWRASHAEGCWQALRRGRSWALPAAFQAAALRQWLCAAHLVDGDRLPWAAIQDGSESGLLQACGRGWYLDLAADAVAVRNAIEATPELAGCVSELQATGTSRARAVNAGAYELRQE